MEAVFVHGDDDAAKLTALAQKAVAANRLVIIDCENVDAAKAAVEAIKDSKPILNGANAENYAAMNEVAKAAGVVLGVKGANVEELYNTIEALEKAGNKNLVIDVTASTAKQTLANAVEVRRAALKDGVRTLGYPSIVNLVNLAKGDLHMQTALASLFTLKYGSIIVMEAMTYAAALPLYGLRQNIFTDPQKPMKVAPGIYPMNGATPDDPCMLTVDFALTYFLVSGEIERSEGSCQPAHHRRFWYVRSDRLGGR